MQSLLGTNYLIGESGVVLAGFEGRGDQGEVTNSEKQGKGLKQAKQGLEKRGLNKHQT